MGARCLVLIGPSDLHSANATLTAPPLSNVSPIGSLVILRDRRSAYALRMVSMQQAVAAMRSLESRIDSPAWLRTIGIGRDPRTGDYRIEMGVSPAALTQVPSEVDGVEICIHPVGEPRL